MQLPYIVINSYTGPILPRLRDIAGFMLKRATPPLFHPISGVFPLDSVANVVALRCEDPKLMNKFIDECMSRFMSKLSLLENSLCRVCHMHHQVDLCLFAIFDFKFNFVYWSWAPVSAFTPWICPARPCTCIFYCQQSFWTNIVTM